MSSLFVPTAETSSLRFFLDLMVGLKKPIMFVGGAGVGMCSVFIVTCMICVACLLPCRPIDLAPGNVCVYTAHSHAAYKCNVHASLLHQDDWCLLDPTALPLYLHTSACSAQARPSWSRASWHSCLRTWHRCPSASTTSLMSYHSRRSWSRPWRRRSVKPCH